MHLEQINLSYVAKEDRILFRIGLAGETPEAEKSEVRLFFTRRLLQRMWPTLMEAMATHLRLNRPEAAFASEEIVSMDHDQAINNISQSGNFDQAYQADNRKVITGDAPLLIETIQFHLQQNALLWIQFHPTAGGTIDVKLNSELLHGFCKLLIDTEKISEWGLELKMPKSSETYVPSHMLN
ncbi:hypothetical protein RF679_12665 [Undibacterium cyanobacteriorum]|uniref:Uncharacterized protein n=1 Tax=Undibacterium cyanobacteriorum TaxID=3073561 RepID=A0ABY9RGW3_9BURK|nr:hypothetical protein [Undibacterium sp. 20NA77.5]WMW79497.1 hypothetical protein RF679_12665 [Undibacterium sp. 20NA77.5]